MEFARFLGLPMTSRANSTDIADAVCQVLSVARLHAENLRRPDAATWLSLSGDNLLAICHQT